MKSILEKIDEYLKRKVDEADPHGTDDVDWDQVKEAVRSAAKKIHGKVDDKKIDGIMKNLYKHKPNDTENAIQIGVDMLRANESVGNRRYRLIMEAGPISEEGALKFVFKLPTEGEFTAEFLDGSSVTIDVDPGDKSSGNFAFIGKDNGRIFQSWTSRPSKEEAMDVLARVKSPKHGNV